MRLEDIGLSFNPKDEDLQTRVTRCPFCQRRFGNGWVFLRHRPEGRDAIERGIDPLVQCLTDRQLERLGMWQAQGGIYWDDRRVSPLDETPDRGLRRFRTRRKTDPSNGAGSSGA